MLDKKRAGYLEGILSAILNTVLFTFKFWVGTATGSVAIVADAWHTLSDTLTSLIVIFGFWASSRPSDKEHPFGHGRAELVGGICIGILLGMVGINFLQDSYHQLKIHESADFNLTVIVVFSISVVLKEIIARFSIHFGKKFNSTSLVADGWHHRSDAIASALILAGVFLGKYFWWIDGVLGLGVSILILKVSFNIIKDAAYSILGEPASQEFLSEIQALAKSSVPEIEDIHHVHIHRYGDHIEATLHIRLSGNRTLKESHDSATRLEVCMKENMNVEATIHMEPKYMDEKSVALDLK